MRKSLKRIILAAVMLVAGSLLASLPSEAALKARGEVIHSVKPGGDLCEALSGLLAKPEQCRSDQLPGELGIVVIKGERRFRFKKDQPIILRAKDTGKTTGMVKAIIDKPADMEKLLQIMKDRRHGSLVFWCLEDGKGLVVISPDKDFMPEKGQQVKIKVKKVTRVEGC